MFPLQAQLWPRGWVEVLLYSSMTAALEGGEWSAARPGCTLAPGKTRYPFYRRLGGRQGRSGWAENLVPPGFDPRTVQSVAQSLYRATRPICTAVVYKNIKSYIKPTCCSLCSDIQRGIRQRKTHLSIMSQICNHTV